MTSATSGDIQLSGATRSVSVTDHSVRSLLAPDRRTSTRNNGTVNGSQTFDDDVLISKRSATECRQSVDDCDDDHMTGPPCKRLCSGFGPAGDVIDHSISSPGSTCRPPFVGVPSLQTYWSPRHIEDTTSTSSFADSDHQLKTPGRSAWNDPSSTSECRKPLMSPSSAAASGLRSTTDSVQRVPRPTSAPSSRHLQDEQLAISDVSVKSADRYEPVVELESDELWRRFYSLCTEMVITKSGRSHVNCTIVYVVD